MKKLLILAIALALLLAVGFVWAEEEDEDEDADTRPPETIAWCQLDQTNARQLDGFLKKFPTCSYAKDAKLDLLLLQRVNDAKRGRIKGAVVIPFKSLGDRWDNWCKHYPNRGAVGLIVDKSGASHHMFSILGYGKMEFDYSQVPVTPTGDGSILGIRSEGNGFPYIGGIVFKSEKGETIYFAVISRKGLVHLGGKGTLTMPDGKKIDLNLDPDPLSASPPKSK